MPVPEAPEASGPMQARLESPRLDYATPGHRPGGLAPLDGGSSRRSTVMRPPVSTGVTRAYQSDSSSKPPRRRPASGPQDLPSRECVDRTEPRPPPSLRHTVGRAARSGGLDGIRRTKIRRTGQQSESAASRFKNEDSRMMEPRHAQKHP